MASNREIRIPADSILALRRSLTRQLGAAAAAQALQEAGHAAGDVLHDRLARGNAGDGLGSLPTDTFWTRLGSLFREAGWGTVEHEELHPGVGALVARDWFEVDPDTRRPSCFFTTGVLANILGRVAGGEVAVLQVECATSEPGCCRFLFGSGPVLQEVYAALRDGRDLETSLGALG
jgi:predicted hydrocarbon binding protein